MAKKFMYVWLGVLALVIAFHVGAKYGQAAYVDPSATGVVASATWGFQYGELLLDDGELWTYSDGNWAHHSQYDLPVPVSQVKFWNGESFVSNDNEFWVMMAGQWTNVGTPPGLVATEPTSWSQIKAEFGLSNPW